MDGLRKKGMEKDILGDWDIGGRISLMYSLYSWLPWEEGSL